MEAQGNRKDNRKNRRETRHRRARSHTWSCLALARGSQDKLLKSDKRRRDQESSGWKPRFQDYSHSLQKSRMNHGWHILGYLYFNPCSANLLVVVFVEVACPVQASEPFPVKRL